MDERYSHRNPLLESTRKGTDRTIENLEFGRCYIKIVLWAGGQWVLRGGRLAG